MAVKSPYEVPPEMRDFAEKSVEQARKAFDSFMGAAHKAAGSISGSTEAVQTGAKDIGQKAMDFAEQNVTAAFDFASRLVHAQDAEEILRLQSEFMKSQLASFGEQAKEIGAAATKIGSSFTATKR
jgi:phasin